MAAICGTACVFALVLTFALGSSESSVDSYVMVPSRWMLDQGLVPGNDDAQWMRDHALERNPDHGRNMTVAQVLEEIRRRSPDDPPPLPFPVFFGDSRPQDLIFFLHIPKTGGMTMTGG